MPNDTNFDQNNKKVLEYVNGLVDVLTEPQDVGKVWRKAYRQWRNWKTFLTLIDSNDNCQLKYGQEMLDAWEAVLERIESLECARDFKGETNPDHSGDNGFNRV